jgi:hypothetical protein
MPKSSELLLQSIHCKASDRPTPAAFSDFSAADWAAFTQAAIQYRFGFQVNAYLRADEARLALVPEPCLEQLKDSIRSTTVINFVQQHRLRQMLVACKERGIPVMLIKGLWLVEQVYRDLGARSSGDIDLVLDPEDMPAFTALAKELGFSIPANVHNICDIAAACNEFELMHPEQGSLFDVHWLLMHPLEDSPIDEDALWRRSEEVCLAEVQCRTLRLEDHLLYLCFHAALHHRFCLVGPRALLDIATLIERPPRPIDWDDVVQRAHELGWNHGAWLMFDLIREHLGVTPPEAVLLALQPTTESKSETGQVREVAIELMFQSQERGELPRNLVRLMTDLTLLGKIALVARRLFPSRRELASQFLVNANTPGLSWLYLRRWTLLVKSSLPEFFRFALGNPKAREEFERSQLIERWVGSAKEVPSARAARQHDLANGVPDR